MRGDEGYRALFRSVVNVFALLVGVGSGLAQLAGFSSRVGHIVLTFVGVSCLLFLVVRFTLLYYVKSDRELRQRLAALQVAHKDYVDAIDRIIDQEGPIYEETLRMTVTVGASDDADTIVEQRHTIPKPRVTQRAIRPVVPNQTEGIVGIDDLKLVVTLVEGHGRITTLPLTTHLKPRVWLVFDPGLSDPFEWKIEYRPCGLWAPLRKGGADTLAWNDRLPAGNGGNSVLKEFVVEFVFPAARRRPAVTERHGFGRCSTPRQLDGGQGWLIEWRDPDPAGHRYEWDLAQAVTT